MQYIVQIMDYFITNLWKILYYITSKRLYAGCPNKEDFNSECRLSFYTLQVYLRNYQSILITSNLTSQTSSSNTINKNWTSFVHRRILKNIFSYTRTQTINGIITSNLVSQNKWSRPFWWKGILREMHKKYLRPHHVILCVLLLGEFFLHLF